MFSTQYGEDQPKLSHYTRAVWPPAGNELGLSKLLSCSTNKMQEKCI
jgi:hypothetical protein